MHPRDWVTPMVATWASQKRRIYTARPDGHVDGWSARSLLGRVIDEGVAGASQRGTNHNQKHPEVYTGDALMIQRAIERMPEFPRSVLITHHVIIDLSIDFKVLALGTSRRMYYHALENAYYYLAGRIDEQKESAAA